MYTAAYAARLHENSPSWQSGGVSQGREGVWGKEPHEEGENKIPEEDMARNC